MCNSMKLYIGGQIKILLAGAFCNLGHEMLNTLVKENHDVIAADLKERDTELKGKYTFKEIDAKNLKH